MSTQDGSAGEYWWAVKNASSTPKTVEPVSGKNFTSASFPAPQAYVLRNDPVARAEFEATAAAELSKSLHFTQAPSEAYALDKMYSSASFPAGHSFAAKSTLQYEPWNPKRFSGYSSK